MYFVTPFSPATNDGGGYASRAIIQYYKFQNWKYLIRSNSNLVKYFEQILGVLIFPFLHPIFTRFVRFPSGNYKSVVAFNFTQTFAASIFYKNSILICHDLQLHRYHFFKSWVLFSERFLLRRAKKVIVLNRRDFNDLISVYGLDSSKVINAFIAIAPNLKPFHRSISIPNKIGFVGGLDRFENREAVTWFIKHVLDLIPAELHIYGKISDFKILHKKVHLRGYVEDLFKELNSVDLIVAPMQSEQGIKIKVVEALSQEIPVIGNANAYSGIFCQCSHLINDSDWVTVLSNPIEFNFELTKDTSNS